MITDRIGPRCIFCNGASSDLDVTVTIDTGDGVVGEQISNIIWMHAHGEAVVIGNIVVAIVCKGCAA